MAANPGGFVRLKITKPVTHPPYNLGYSVGEDAIVTAEVAELLVRDERATLMDAKAGSAEKPSESTEKAVSKQAATAETR